jgi:hypothetical protein
VLGVGSRPTEIERLKAALPHRPPLASTSFQRFVYQKILTDFCAGGINSRVKGQLLRSPVWSSTLSIKTLRELSKISSEAPCVSGLSLRLRPRISSSVLVLVSTVGAKLEWKISKKENGTSEQSPMERERRGKEQTQIPRASGSVLRQSDPAVLR